MVLTCKPSAMHWAPAPDISFCQRDSPSNLKFNFSASPSNCALVSVRAFLPSSSVTKVRFLHSAAEHTHAELAQTDPPPCIFHLLSVSLTISNWFQSLIPQVTGIEHQMLQYSVALQNTSHTVCT